MLCTRTVILILLSVSALSANEPSVYLSWQDQPETTMTVQWLANDSEDTSISYKEESGSENSWTSLTPTLVPLPQMQGYFIHRVEIKDLKPNRSYQFYLNDDKDKIYLFRTMPSSLDIPIRFAVGGDVYHDEIVFVRQINKQVALTSPDFVIVGGDIAYGVSSRSANKPQDMERWVTWITAWCEDMITPDGYLIPMLALIGNHDVAGQFNQPPIHADVFHALCPNLETQGFKVVDFGDYLSFFLLNTGHTASVEGIQKNWLQQALQNRQDRSLLMAAYHVPAYPSVRKFNNKLSAAVREHWVPLFEQYGLDMAFEHHDHAYKRTYPILKSKVDYRGVIYMGDGAWGVARPRKIRGGDQAWYLANAKSTRHVIIVDVDKEKRYIRAVDFEGNVFDEFTLRRTALKQAA